MPVTKFLFVQIFLLISLLLSGASASLAETGLRPVTIQDAQDLQQDGQRASTTHKPILILFAMHGCAYCRYIEEEHLKPMLRNAGYRSKVIIRRVMTDDYSRVRDFNGQEVAAQDLAQRYRASFTPTVVFVDDGGKLIERIVGVRNTEFYGGELDDGLDLALLQMRNKLARLNPPAPL